MALSAGMNLGPHEILESSGKGGTGEVLKVRHPSLRRDIAIGVSAAQFGERFDRDAAAIALDGLKIRVLRDAVCCRSRRRQRKSQLDWQRIGFR